MFVKNRVPRAPCQPITSRVKPDEPFSTIHVDVLESLLHSNGFKFVLAIVDAFTKFCLLYALYRQDNNELKRVFENAISLFGVHKLLIFDRGRMFQASSFTEMGTGNVLRYSL